MAVYGTYYTWEWGGGGLDFQSELQEREKKANEEKKEFSGSVAHGAADW